MTVEATNMTSLPTVLWAPRSDRIYVTIEVSDVENEKIDIQPTKLSFTGTGSAERKEYAFEIDLFGEVDPEKSKYVKNSMHILLQLARKEEGEFWPRLIKTGKLHFVKTDFKKWIDEDEEDEPIDMDGGMGGMPGMGGPPGMGGMGGMPGMGGMGGMGGMPGMGGMGGMPGMEGMDMSKMADLQKMMAQMQADGDGGEGTPDFSKFMGDGAADLSAEGDEEDDDELPPLEKFPSLFSVCRV
eukprot:CFRG4562T1